MPRHRHRAAPPGRGPVERPVSAGGVVRRASNGVVEVVLCGRRNGALWTLPKGTPDEGESLEETALREVREETGLEVRLDTAIDRIHYWFVRPTDGRRCFKTVHFYLMSPQGGSTRDHDPEFDEVRWFPVEQALKVMTHDNERQIVERAASMSPEE